MKLMRCIGLPLLVLLTVLILLQTSSVAEGFPSHDTKSSREITLTILGRVVNTQGIPIEKAKVRVLIDGEEQPIHYCDSSTSFVLSRSDGVYIANIHISHEALQEATFVVEISKPGFQKIQSVDIRDLLTGSGEALYAQLPEITLPRVNNQALVLATGIFILVIGIISFNLMHETTAAFIGAAAMLGTSYIFGSHNPNYWILSFQEAITYIDFDVIFLIMSMMIIVSILGRTGAFQWLALSAYRSARGSAWRLAVILMVITAFLSAFLNNVTIMLLMAPITIGIALILGITPVALIIPEVLASNIGGIATLIGDPPNTIIASYAGVSFMEFLRHMGPMAIIAMIALIIVIYIVYSPDYLKVSKSPGESLLTRLEEDAQITDPLTLRRTLIIIAIMMVMFFTCEYFLMPPSVVAMIAATALLVWIRPSIEEMMGEVDWTTLFFFMNLFIMIGGLQEVGLIQRIAETIAGFAGSNLLLATITVIWVSALASAFINNIPFTAAILPIVTYLMITLPGEGNFVLLWALSLGANLGGNATYIGSAPNVVSIGVLDRAGYRITFGGWLRVGIPVTIITLLIPTLWIVLRYFYLHF